MKRRKHLLTLLLLLPGTLLASPSDTLSAGAEISLLTCAPGDQLYSLFGHTAIRVRDPRGGMDIVFNYGTFDFRTRGFYLKFARGLLPYNLSRTTFSDFMAEYHYYQRGVREQTLLLSPDRRQRLWELLSENYRPENRTYLYNFLYDNCTTRARDIIDAALDHDVAWDAPRQDKNFWNLLDECLEISPWTRWGIHTILGVPANANAIKWEQMFLPDYLLRGLAYASHDGKPVALPPRALIDLPDSRPRTPWYLAPAFAFAVGTALLILILSLFRGRRLLAGVAAPLFIVTGITGCLLLFLGYFTLHPTTAPNANLLWASPVNLLVVPFLWRRRLPGVIRGYLFGYLAWLATYLVICPFIAPAALYSNAIIIVLMGFLVYRLRGGCPPRK
ncbi:MAG: DUF4105 domain-containing protein [Odoribacteraceae bacterium]|jgi:hypothetical protein|nr:DUF4105 domain-containing protein [Odoribacteraceae bacterium]